MDTNPTQPAEVLGRTTKIVMMAMTIVMVCVALSLVVVVLNERSTQRNADHQTDLNRELSSELRCLRQPQFEADKNNAEINVVLARALAALAQGQDDTLESLVPELSEEANQLESSLRIWNEAITTCQRGAP